MLPASALGDPGAPYDIELIVTDALLSDQLSRQQATRPACAAAAATPAPGTPAPEPTAATVGRGATPDGERTLRDASVRLLDNGTILVQGTTSLYEFSLPGRVILQPRVVDGLLEFAVVTSEVGCFRLPTAASDQLTSALNRQLRASMADLPFRLVALTPGQGTLAIRLQIAGTPGVPGDQPPGQGC